MFLHLTRSGRQGDKIGEICVSPHDKYGTFSEWGPLFHRRQKEFLF